MAAYVGKKFRVDTIGGDAFEGILHSLDVNNRKISLMKVSIVPSGKRLSGLLHFYGQEILQLTPVIDEPEDKTKQESKSPGHPNEDEDDESETDDVTLDTEISQGYVYLTRLGTKFRQAMDHIRSQQLIGVCTEAERLGRKAKMSLLQVFCNNQVYIFDVLSLGPAVFTEGLADILESEAIVKVMHDSRWASDQLYHQYSVKLTNVYDTQAADALATKRQLNGVLPQKLSSLPECLMKYLGVSNEEVYAHLLHARAMETEADSSWLERPLPPKLLSLAAGKVSHLPELHTVTLHHLLDEFRASVDIFLGCVRDMSDIDRSKANVSPSLVPRQLEKLVYGNLPTTNPPASSHGSMLMGYHPFYKEVSPQVQHHPPHPSASPNTATSNTPSREPPESAPPTSQAPSGNRQSFYTPKMVVNKKTSDPSPARLTNGFTPSDGDNSLSKQQPASTTTKHSTFIFSPSSDGKSVIKLGKESQQSRELDMVSSSPKQGNSEGFWDVRDDFGRPAPQELDHNKDCATVPDHRHVVNKQTSSLVSHKDQLPQELTGARCSSKPAGKQDVKSKTGFGMEDNSDHDDNGDDEDSSGDNSSGDGGGGDDDGGGGGGGGGGAAAAVVAAAAATGSAGSAGGAGGGEGSGDDDESNDDDSRHGSEAVSEKDNGMEWNSEREDTTDHVPSHSTPADLLLSLSPGRRRTLPSHQITSSGTKTRGRTVANSYLSSRGVTTKSDSRSRENSGSRLYSTVLKDAGLVRSSNRRGETLNIESPTQFPELDPEVQEKPKKQVLGHDGRSQCPRSAPTSGDDEVASREPNARIDEDAFPEIGRHQRHPGAIPKIPSMRHSYSQDIEAPFPSANAESAGLRQGSPQGLTNHRMTSPTIGRGRARVIECHEDILRNIRKPVDLQMKSQRVQKYDFPSKEEIDKVPKRLPDRASSYRMVTEIPDHEDV